jgi:hypothetical protein
VTDRVQKVQRFWTETITGLLPSLAAAKEELAGATD